jgi:hypothetical protein
MYPWRSASTIGSEKPRIATPRNFSPSQSCKLPQGARTGMGLFDDRVEHRGEVTRRGIDDLQHLGGRGLLLQGLARLGQEPRILHRNDRLRREVFEKRDFFFPVGPHLGPARDYHPHQRIGVPQGDEHQGAGARLLDRRPRHRIVALRQVADVNEGAPASKGWAAGASEARWPRRNRWANGSRAPRVATARNSRPS